MTETERHINRIKNLFSYITTAERDSLTAAIKALRACEKIRALIEIDRISHDTVQIFELEELLPK